MLKIYASKPQSRQRGVLLQSPRGKAQPNGKDDCPSTLENCVWDIAFHPKGKQLLVACTNHVLVLKPPDGKIVHTLKGHRGPVYCVAYNSSGEYFASGSADKSVIFWSDKLEALSKYFHNDAVQKVVFNPKNQALMSFAVTDMGQLYVGNKQVSKTKTKDRVCCCRWNKSGTKLALGYFNGMLEVQNCDGKELFCKDLGRNTPIWALDWSEHSVKREVLVVTDWNRTLSFYSASGKQIGGTVNLEFDPYCVSWCPGGQYIVVGGSDCHLYAYNCDGLYLGIVETFSSRIWSCKFQENNAGRENLIAVGCEDGTLTMFPVKLLVQHAVYRNIYATCQNLTDIKLRYLPGTHIEGEAMMPPPSGDQLITCEKRVLHISLYKEKLAVLKPGTLSIYEQDQDSNSLHFDWADQLDKKIDADQFALCNNHFIMSKGKKLDIYAISGTWEKEWLFESIITCIHVIGGPPKSERFLVGLQNGQVCDIYLRNPFVKELFNVGSTVSVMSVNKMNCRLAIVNAENILLVYDLKTLELLYEEVNAKSVCWSNMSNEILCYTTHDCIFVNIENVNVYKRRMAHACVIGFQGNLLYILFQEQLRVFEFPVIKAVNYYVERRKFASAVPVAYIGITREEWHILGKCALLHFDLISAVKAFQQTKNIFLLDLCEMIGQRLVLGENKPLLLADIWSHMGQWEQAEQLYLQANAGSRAMQMYIDLRMFDRAQTLLPYADEMQKKLILSKQAEWLVSVGDIGTAADLFKTAGDYSKAVSVLGEHGLLDKLLAIASSIPTLESTAIAKAAWYMKKKNRLHSALELYQKIGDIGGLIGTHIEAKHWEDALILAQRHPTFGKAVYIPYADYLFENDRFLEAQQIYVKAGLEKHATNFLEQLLRAAVQQERFSDAAYFSWRLSNQLIAIVPSQREEDKGALLFRSTVARDNSELYHCYGPVHQYFAVGFGALEGRAILSRALFLLQFMGSTKPVPDGLSRMKILYTMAEQARIFGANKLAYKAYARLQRMKIPKHLQPMVDKHTIVTRSRPMAEPESLLLTCFRCFTKHSPMSLSGNCCRVCNQKFVFCGLTYQMLPVIQFFLHPDIGISEARRAINTSKPMQEDFADFESDDLFTEKCKPEDESSSYLPIIADQPMLESLGRTEVIICQHPTPFPAEFYKLIDPDVDITQCTSCCKLFLSEPFEIAMLQPEGCPICRNQREQL